MEKYFNEVIRPLIEGDGGELVFVRREGETVYVTARAECSKCNILDRCISWAEDRIFAGTGEKVKLVYTRQKPFFWDK